MNTSWSRRGFSLTEVLLVLAIITILIGLLIPAVQRVRESASRIQCMNNMKQIALAVREYEVVIKTLPPAGIGYGWCGVLDGFESDPHIVNQNGLSLLLPYLGQEELDAKLDRTKAFSLAQSPYFDDTYWPTGPSVRNVNGQNPVQNGSAFTAMDLDLANNVNLLLMSTPLQVFRCPSDPGNPMIPADGAQTSPYTPIFGPGGNYAGAKTSYDFVVNWEDLSWCNCWPDMNKLGLDRYMFGQNSNCPIARVTDGMSNTFMLAETCFQVSAGATAPAWGYRSWAMTGIDINAGDSGIGINGWRDEVSYGTLRITGTPGSLHPGGCLFAMGDGTVRWVSENITNKTLYSLSTIAGGEVADLD